MVGILEPGIRTRFNLCQSAHVVVPIYLFQRTEINSIKYPSGDYNGTLEIVLFLRPAVGVIGFRVPFGCGG